MTAREVLAGKVLKYYGRIGVASVMVKAPLRRGDLIGFRGHVTDFDQRLESMQMNHRDVPAARPGDIVGIKVNHYVRKNDRIFIL